MSATISVHWITNIKPGAALDRALAETGQPIFVAAADRAEARASGYLGLWAARWPLDLSAFWDRYHELEAQA